MAQPTVQDVYAALLAAKERIDSTLAAVEANSPEILRPAEQVVHVAFDVAFAAVDVPALTGALVAAAETIKAGRGPTEGGLDSNLA